MKQKTTLTLLDIKNEAGLFTNTTEIYTTPLHTINDVCISYRYPTARSKKPDGVTVTYSGITVLIDSTKYKLYPTINEYILDFTKHFGSDESTRLSIINRYKELKLI